MNEDHLTVGSKLVTGICGMTVNALAVLTSMQEQIEWGMRIFSLVVGITVGFLTIWSLLKKKAPK